MFQKWVNIDGKVYWVSCTPDTPDIEILRRLIKQIEAGTAKPS